MQAILREDPTGRTPTTEEMTARRLASVMDISRGPTALPVTPGNVWREITTIRSAQTSQAGADKAIDGATGTINYGGDITRHVPLNKQIAILRVSNGQLDPNIQGFCGTIAGRVPSTWCPPGD